MDCEKGRRRIFAVKLGCDHESPSANRGQVAVPTFDGDQPRAQSPPGVHVLAAIGQHGAIGLPPHHGVLSGLNRNISGITYPLRFKAKALESLVAKLAAGLLNRPGSLSKRVIRDHRNALRRKQRRHLIIISSIEGHAKVLRKAANHGFNILKATRNTTRAVHRNSSALGAAAAGTCFFRWRENSTGWNAPKENDARKCKSFCCRKCKFSSRLKADNRKAPGCKATEAQLS